jgi:hypothetical protein
MIISFGNFFINSMQPFLIYSVMFFLILASAAAIAVFVWVCLTPGGDPVFNIPRISSRGRNEKAENVKA